MVNVLVVLLVRNEYVVNVFFWVFVDKVVIKYFFLRVRRLGVKIYFYGGVYFGCVMVVMVWYIVFFVFLMLEWIGFDIVEE